MKSKLVIVTIFFCAVIPVKLFAQPQMGSDYPTVDHANIAVFLIDFPDTKDSIRALYPSLEEIRKELFDSTRTIQKYLKTMSYGKFKLTGDVFGPFRHQDPITADNKYQSNGYLTINSIKIPDFQYSKYTHFAFISFNDYINWGGCAFGKSNINPTYVTINNSKFEMFDYFRMVIQVGYYERNKANFFINTFLEPHPFIVEVPYEQHPDGEFYFQNYTGITYFQRGFLHEFIHTLHVWNHANSKTNSNRYTFEPEVPNNYDIYTNQDFLNIEYGNGFDMMGTANFSFSLNGGIRDLLGWTDNTNRVKLDTYSKQRIRLYPINRKEGYRICEIRLPDKYYSRDITKDVLDFPENGRKNRGYFLEVREVDKWDSTLIHPSINANTSGIILLETDGWTTYLLDASPSLNLDRNYLPDPGFCPDMRDVVLKPGMIYKNSEVYFSNVEKHNDGSYSVDIEIFDPSDPERLVPVARAGAGQTVNEGSVVSLDGSASSDPDGNTLTYKWTAPAGITLSSTTGAKPIFTAPEVTANTNYTLSLVVNDGTVDSPVDQVVITIKNVNKVPVANAGMDQSVNEGSTINLDGSASSDPDGSTITYKWTAPAGITLNSTISAKPTFTAPEVTENTNYTFSLVVNDGTVDSPIDQVVITVKNVNKAPVANAGVDQSVNEGASVSLGGTASSDPDGNPLTYKWTSPAGITLSSTTVAKPTFTAPEVKKDSTLNFSLIVNDGLVNSLPSTVKVSVLNVIKVGVSVVESALLKVYPNPTKGIIQVEFCDIPQSGTWITVYDISGKTVCKMTAKNKIETLNLNNRPAGLYFIRIDQKLPETFKIILEKTGSFH